jgi:hypothetical protein
LQKKGKVSKKGVRDDTRLLGLVKDVFTERLGQYPHSYEVSSLCSIEVTS